MWEINLILFFFILNIQNSVPTSANERVRNPRIFFPLTTSTSTVTATEANLWTVCFKTSTTLGVCAKRKRRMLVDDVAFSDVNIDPVRVEREIIDGEGDEDTGEDLYFEAESSSRDPRFMIYWTTITKTSTTTSYLSTSTIASVICTPSNFIYKTC